MIEAEGLHQSSGGSEIIRHEGIPEVPESTFPIAHTRFLQGDSIGDWYRFGCWPNLMSKLAFIGGNVKKISFGSGFLGYKSGLGRGESQKTRI